MCSKSRTSSCFRQITLSFYIDSITLNLPRYYILSLYLSHMLNIGSRIAELRKAKGWSQADLAKALEASRDIVGKYERNDNAPSIEMASKIADVFEVSLDYLLGKEQKAFRDKVAVKRLEDIENLDSDTRGTLFNIIDTFIRDSKARKAYSS